MFVWPCILNMKWFVRPTWCNNYDLLINQWLNMFRATLCPSSGVQGCTLLRMVFSTVNISQNKMYVLWSIVCNVKWCLVSCVWHAVGCVLCDVLWPVFYFSQVKVLSGEWVWFRGVIVLENCVPWLEVSSNVWFNVNSEWLQVVCGCVLCAECMWLCGSVSEGFF